ncbi:MAG: ferredoxin [Pseudomonadota bacterium]
MSMGAFHPKPDDGAPPGTGTLILLGPAEPGFWDRFTASPEFSDGAADPLDRWSTRIISAIAAEFGAQALFPFGGPPYQPFIAWAKRSGRAWQSPVTLLVHDTAGLMVSYRGALALRERLSLPLGPNRPCDTCSAPCLTACPAGALGGAGYDLDTCHRFLDTRHGSECLGKGCAVRRSCPISQSYGREPVQSAYHMGIFHR